MIGEHPDRWNKTLQECRKGHFHDHATLCHKSTSWHSCAVGESLKDIGIEAYQEETAKKFDSLADEGVKFHEMVQDKQWSQALLALRIIKGFVQTNRKAIRAQYKIIDDCKDKIARLQNRP